MIKKIAKPVLIIGMLSASMLLKAQTTPPPADPPSGDNTVDNPVPFDGGVSCLVGAAVLYGFKKAHGRKKNAGKNAVVL